MSSASEVDAGSRDLRRVMLFMGLFLVLVQVNRSGGAVIANYLRAERGIGPTELAIIMGAMFLASALVQLPAGLLYDRYGPRRTLAIMNLVATVGLVVFAFGSSVGGLVAGRFLIGIGHGTVIAGIYMFAMARAEPSRVASVSGTVIALGGGIGSVLATAPLALTLDGVGFRASFTGVAVFTLVFSAVLMLAVRDNPRESTARPVDEARSVETIRDSLRGLWEVAVDRQLWPIFVMGTCFTAPFLAIGGLWAGPYLRDVYSLDTTTAGYVLLAMMLALYMGYFLYGALDRALNTRRWVILGGIAGMVTALVVLAVTPRPSLGFSVTMLMIFSICSPLFVTLAAHCRGFVPSARVGRAIACINLMGLMGVFVLQLGTGFVVQGRLTDGGAIDSIGYQLVFATVAAVLVVCGSYYATARDAPARGLSPRT